MKSVAFNLAFKVHRGEMDFRSGLLQSEQEEAAEDFIDALNSLAGEIKYDKDQIGALIADASAGAPKTDDSAKADEEKKRNTAAVDALTKEIETLEKKIKNYSDSLETMQNVLAARDHFIMPWLNSVLVLMVLSVIIMLLIVWRVSELFMIILALAGIIGAGALFFKDLKTLQHQKDEAKKRRERAEGEIRTIEQAMATVKAKLDEKRDKLAELQALLKTDEVSDGGDVPPAALATETM